MFVHVLTLLPLNIVIRTSNEDGDALSGSLTDYYKERERKSCIEHETASLLKTISFSCKQARRFCESQYENLMFILARVGNKLS